MTSFEPRVTRRPVRRLTYVQAKLAVLLAAALLMVAHGRSHAEQLRYRAPAPCPPANRFEHEVAARLGFSPWRGRAPLEVQFTAQSRQLYGRVAHHTNPKNATRRDVCASL